MLNKLIVIRNTLPQSCQQRRPRQFSQIVALNAACLKHDGAAGGKIDIYGNNIHGPAGDVSPPSLVVKAVGGAGSATPLKVTVKTLGDSLGESIAAQVLDGVVTVVK